MKTNSVTVNAMHKAIDKLASQFDNNLCDSVRREVKSVTLIKRPVYQHEVEGKHDGQGSRLISRLVVGERILASAKITLDFRAEHAEIY